MTERFRKFKDKADILKACNELLRNEKLLDGILAEIESLKRGKVLPEDTIRRSQIGSYFSSTIQQIANFIDKKAIRLTEQRKTNMARVSYKAEKVLRENIILQSVPPLDVIKFEHVPIRHSYSSKGKREQRWGYGLHMKPFNEEGHSVTVANMPPNYTQSLHNHTLSEYCLILDGRTEGIFFPGGKKERIYSTNKSQMLHFSATTPHTLRNPTKKYTRNITFKQSVGLTDWRPASSLNTVKTVRARLIKGSTSRINETQTHTVFRVKDRYYDYTLEVIKLEKNTTYTHKHPYNQFIFVITGKLTITHDTISKNCQKNDFIVIDKDTEYTIKTNTACRLYTIRGEA